MSAVLLVMSAAATPASSNTHFQAIFQAALNAYQKQTKKDLLTHPLTSQLQSCESTTARLAILQVQVQEYDRSRSGNDADERLTKWLSPTVYVLDAFSAAVSVGVSLVGLNLELRGVSDICFVGRFTCNCDLRKHWCLPFGEYIIYFLGQIVLMS